MHRFQTVIRRARFVYSLFTAYEMQVFAQVLADSIRTRIQSGQNILGRRGCRIARRPAASNPTHPDWTWSGHTLRCLKVLTANENRAAIVSR
jgi:hypothetical protein